MRKKKEKPSSDVAAMSSNWPKDNHDISLLSRLCATVSLVWFISKTYFMQPSTAVLPGVVDNHDLHVVWIVFVCHAHSSLLRLTSSWCSHQLQCCLRSILLRYKRSPLVFDLFDLSDHHPLSVDPRLPPSQGEKGLAVENMGCSEAYTQQKRQIWSNGRRGSLSENQPKFHVSAPFCFSYFALPVQFLWAARCVTLRNRLDMI